MKTFYDRARSKAALGEEPLTPVAWKSYKYREENARKYKVEPSSDTVFLVTTPHGHRRIVRLPTRTSDGQMLHPLSSCECRLFQEYVAPCSHAIAAIKFIEKEPLDYFFETYTRDYYRKIYRRAIEPVNITDLKATPWIEPPLKVKKRGRPTTQRIRNHVQEEKEKRRCGECKQFGHYKNRCPNKPVKNGRAQRTRDAQVIDDDTEYDDKSDWDTPSEAEGVEDDSLSESPPDGFDSDLTNSEYEEVVEPSPKAEARFQALVEKMKQAGNARKKGGSSATNSGSKVTSKYKAANPKPTAYPKAKPKAEQSAKSKGKRVAVTNLFTEKDHQLLVDQYEAIFNIPKDMVRGAWESWVRKVCSIT